MPSEQTVQFIAILSAVTGLLGWLIKQVINYFISSASKKDSCILDLVGQNQQNTIEFIETINHQRTKDREMQARHVDAITALKNEIKSSNELNTKLFNLLNKDK